MNVLIVYAHPESKSFNGAMRDVAIETLRRAGNEVVVGQEERQAYLDAYRKRLLEVDTTPRLFFHPIDDYGPNERLKPGIRARSGVQRNV